MSEKSPALCKVLGGRAVPRVRAGARAERASLAAASPLALFAACGGGWGAGQAGGRAGGMVRGGAG